ncbi:MAG: VIT1/CCC1 transporter family protein [Candidatus Pacebacteria bacterium]|nr:VIT1/CCC1 transporter family protein [Candidatus Paceibacterota bacterium]
MPKTRELYIRNIIFGISDSLVSTVGLLAGIDVSGTSKHIIILTGVTYAFVEAFSMAVGSFLSEESVEEDTINGEVHISGPFMAGNIMFISFIIASFIPIIPYLFFGLTTALFLSIGISIIALFIVGVMSASQKKVHILKSGLRMALLGGMAIIMGVVVGKFLNIS